MTHCVFMLCLDEMVLSKNDLCSFGARGPWNAHHAQSITGSPSALFVPSLKTPSATWSRWGNHRARGSRLSSNRGQPGRCSVPLRRDKEGPCSGRTGTYFIRGILRRIGTVR